MIDLTADETIFLKCLIDIDILESSRQFQNPTYLSIPNEIKADPLKLKKNHLIFYYDRWNITDKGRKAYHQNMHKATYDLKMPLKERLRKSLKTHNKQESETES